MQTQPVERRRTRLTRAERKAETREHLLEAAMRVFARKGYAGASVDDIAEEAGFTVGALYSNFDGKQGLFLAAFERHCDQDLAQLEAIMNGPGTLQERLEAFGEQFVKLTEEHRQWWLLSTELWLYAQRDDGAGARMAALERKVRSIVADALRGETALGGPSRPGHAIEVAAAALALWRGLLQQRLLDPEAVSAATFTNAITWLLRGAAAGPGQSPARVKADGS
jgi:AcrR family transcriptional regulator